MPAYRSPYENRPYWEHAGHEHRMLHLLVCLAALALLAVIVALTIRALRKGRSFGVSSAPVVAATQALDIARVRYAKGEIKRAEFLRIAADLGAPNEADETPPPPE